MPTPHLIPRHQCARTQNFNTKHTWWFITALFDIFHLFSIYDSIDHVISISHDKPSQSPSTRQIQPPITTAPSNSSGENVILRTLTIWYISTTIYPPMSDDHSSGSSGNNMGNLNLDSRLVYLNLGATASAQMGSRMDGEDDSSHNSQRDHHHHHLAMNRHGSQGGCDSTMYHHSHDY